MQIYTVDTGRFRVNTHAGQCEIYDSKKPHKDSVGREIPAHRIREAASFTDVEIYRLALVWLRDSQLIKSDIFEKAAAASFSETSPTPSSLAPSSQKRAARFEDEGGVSFAAVREDIGRKK